jgi:hypothetical protein
MPALRRQAIGLILITVAILLYALVRYWGNLQLHAR